ncbi:MAG: hypothetical protein AAF596_05080 [Planctomycetota bacterium]
MLGRGDILLLILAVMIAVSSLLRLMRARRNTLVAEVQKQVDAQREAFAAQQAAEAAAAKKAARNKNAA